jgi:hypothetical protein
MKPQRQPDRFQARVHPGNYLVAQVEVLTVALIEQLAGQLPQPFGHNHGRRERGM